MGGARGTASDSGITSFWSLEGSLVMTITDEQAQAGFDDQYRRYEEGTGYALFVRTRDGWFEATLPQFDGASPEHVAVGEDSIVLGAIEYQRYEEQRSGANRLTVHVGHLR